MKRSVRHNSSDANTLHILGPQPLALLRGKCGPRETVSSAKPSREGLANRLSIAISQGPARTVLGKERCRERERERDYIYVCICGNTWTDALHAAHFELLLPSVQTQVGWSIFIVLYPGQHYVCVCAYLRASILFFMTLVYLEFQSHPRSTSLFVSCLLVLAGLR